MFLRLFMHNNVMLRKKMKENEATNNIMMKDLMRMKRRRFSNAAMNLIRYQNLKLITSTTRKWRWKWQCVVMVKLFDVNPLTCVSYILSTLKTVPCCFKKNQVGLSCHAYGTSPWDYGRWMMIKFFEVLQIQVVQLTHYQRKFSG